MATTSPIATLGASKYISLTTFRKDGSAVATPVWLVRDGNSLRVITDPASGKAKRLRNNPAVRVSPCDMRGRVKPGAISVGGAVSFQDADSTRETMALIEKRYGLMGRILTRMNERRARKAGGGASGHVGLVIAFDTDARQDATD
jgi:PPOX class probable F420-dependent enzyme